MLNPYICYYKLIKLKLKYLTHHQIDKERWDSAIKDSQNRLLYALSWYLDIVSPNWEAIVSDNYKIVMPLTIKDVNGKRCFYKPFFLQFLGVFGNNLDEEIIYEFIKEAKSKVDCINVWFNPENMLTESDHYKKRQTQILELNKSLEDLLLGCNRSNKLNLKKAEKANLFIKKEDNIEELISTFNDMYNKKNVEGVTNEDYINLRKIANYAYKNLEYEYYSVYHNNNVCSIALLIKWEKRYVTYCATSDIGRDKRSIFLLYNQFIKDHAEENAILDFAGSNIPGVAYMNKGFGAVEQNYFSVEFDNL